jgi:hypothetical protein
VLVTDVTTVTGKITVCLKNFSDFQVADVFRKRMKICCTRRTKCAESFDERLSEILSLYRRRTRDVPRRTFRWLNSAGWYTEYGKYGIFQVAP